MERIGHRGAPHIATENTLASFISAADLGVDAVELDVRLTDDGTLIVLHDASLERTTSGHGPAARLSAAELAALGVPRYSEVLAALHGRCAVTCEIKEPQAASAALAATSDADALGTTVFTCFDLEVLAALRAQSATVRLGGLISQPDDAFLTRLTTLGAELADVYWPSLTRAWCDTAHHWGLRVRAWTVNDDDALHHAVAAGVDGVMSDRAAWLLESLGADGSVMAS